MNSCHVAQAGQSTLLSSPLQQVAIPQILHTVCSSRNSHPLTSNIAGAQTSTASTPGVSLAPAEPAAAAASQASAPSLPVQQPAPPVTSRLAGSSEFLPAASDKMDPNCTVQLHINLPDGEKLRGSFKGSTLLQDVHSYVQQNKPELHNQDYSISALGPRILC